MNGASNGTATAVRLAPEVEAAIRRAPDEAQAAMLGVIALRQKVGATAPCDVAVASVISAQPHGRGLLQLVDSWFTDGSVNAPIPPQLASYLDIPEHEFQDAADHFGCEGSNAMFSSPAGVDEFARAVASNVARR